MEQQRTDWIGELRGALAAVMAEACGMGTTAFNALLAETDVLRRLGERTFSKDAICAEVLDACAPAMERLCATPRDGWLLAAHDFLAYGPYPAPEHPPEPAALVSALRFYIAALTAAIAYEAEGRAFDPLCDVRLLSEDEYRDSRIAEEYAAFTRAVRDAGYIELLHIARECKSFDPLSHTAGVHHVAVHTARQMRACGLPADVALVSAAALSHDIGKFGCRNDDAKRIPFLHYYYTDQWLRRCNLPHIAHVAANHSTWDLEYENLPAESLVLIYSDFRVRGERGAKKEDIRIQTLESAGDIIFHKLSNVDDGKRRRYALVYRKLCDFEAYLVSRGVNPDVLSDALLPVTHIDNALLTDEQAESAIRRMAVEHNILFMESVSASDSFERLLERARSEKNLESIRTYLNLFDEYFPYMTRAHKLQLLGFLYELLMHHARDVRRQAGQLMGRILANSGLQYRKDLPERAPETAIAPTLSEMLAECAALWDSYLTLLISPDPKIERRHRLRIQNSLKVVAGSLMHSCKNADARLYLDPFLRRFSGEPPSERFALADSITHVPAARYSLDELIMLVDFVRPMLLGPDAREQICALRALNFLAEARPSDARARIGEALTDVSFEAGGPAAFLAGRLVKRLGGEDAEQTDMRVSELYLDNLKTTVHWIVKVANIDRLLAYARECHAEAFHVATHFGNLMLVSEHLPVREHAGQALSGMTELLSVEEVNEIVIDLCRGLESGQAEVSRFVAPCLAALMQRLPAGQLDETVALLTSLVRSDNANAACAALSAFGALLERLLTDNGADGGADGAARAERRDRMVGVLMCGLAHFDDAVHRAALTVFCRELFGNARIPLAARRQLFVETGKKLLTIVSERAGNDITFFNTAAMLNHLYRMLLVCAVDLGPCAFPAPGPVAFFPGAFDPFSDGHKRIVTEIRARGFTVYLAVDEFSWSKRTQPKRLRRQIVLMSVADCAGVYLFPDDVPINIANPGDLARLKRMFEGRETYLVAGSDVIENASAYADDAPQDGAKSMPHILFRRSGGEKGTGDLSARARLSGTVITLTLPTYYEDMSSSRIRENIDKNIEISSMVDPVAEAFIRRRGLYLRTPQYKRRLKPEEKVYTVIDHADEVTAHVLRALEPSMQSDILSALRSGRGLVSLLTESGAAACGAAYGHTVGAAELLPALHSMERAEYVRGHASGKILAVDGLAGCEGEDAEDAANAAELVTELLTASLGSDHTYALYRRRPGDERLFAALIEKGFVPAGGDDVYMVDMRAPAVITCDMFMMLKEPYASDAEVIDCVLRARRRLLSMLCEAFPGGLVLSFDTARINRALIKKVQQYNGVLGLPETPRRLGPFMCVPYGKILSDVVVPNTVTKTLHAEKVFAPDIRHFTIEEAQGYSPLPSQLAAIRSFSRPVLLVDDLLHNGYRLEKLDPLFTQAGLDIKKILVGILSGRGKDLMDLQGRGVDTVYWIPNLQYWFTESLLYPFIGGDSVRRTDENGESVLPSINLILPYKSPDYLRGVTARAKRRLSMTALTNTYEILHLLEQRHRALWNRSLTLSRLGEALLLPRMPDRGRVARYDGSVPASAYIRDDIEWMQRLTEEI